MGGSGSVSRIFEPRSPSLLVCKTLSFAKPIWGATRAAANKNGINPFIRSSSLVGLGFGDLVAECCLYGSFYLLEGPQIYLADALSGYSILRRERFKFRRIV